MSFAFFDFDNTIIHGDAGPLLGIHMFKRHQGRIDDRSAGAAKTLRKMATWTRVTPYLSWMAVQAVLYKARARRRSSIVRSAFKGWKGVPVDLLERTLDGFVDEEIAPRIFPEIRKEMEAHAAAGRTCVIVTTGMERLVARALPYLPAGTQLIGCRLEERDGRFTGAVQGPLYGADKANIITAYCRAADVDPADCWAYSDHYSDHQMLQAVGHGVCVNPASRLEAMAKTQGWQVLRPADPTK